MRHRATVYLMHPPTTPTSPHVGGEFRAAREGAGVALRALADEAGIDHSTLSRWERGERQISTSTYEHLSHTLADYLAGKWTA